MPLPQLFFSETYWQRSRTALDLALETAPVYRSWQTCDPGKEAPIDARYQAMPELTKKDMRESFPQGLVPSGRRVEEGLASGEIEYVNTSGTTEEKVTNLWNQTWWNAAERASWKLNAHTAHLDGTQPEAQLTSALSVGVRSEQDLPMSARRLGRFLFLNEKVSPREWTDAHYARMLAELAEYRPEVLEANPSYLAHLAWWALAQGRQVYSPRVILFTYEFASALHVRDIRRVFQSPLVSSYGATEAGYVLMECEHGTLHQNTEFCRIDFEPLKPEYGGPELGRILVTTFQNPWTSLVRFDVGDLVRLDPRPACPCGRAEGLRVLAVEGRSANLTFTTGGRPITTKALDDQLARVAGARDYTLEQTAPRAYRLLLVASENPAAAASQAREVLEALYGPGAEVTVELQADLEPGPSGKYRRTRALFDYSVKGFFA
jgi:phenylacetate-CoA ligase